MITIENLQKQYSKGVSALENLNLEIEEEKLIALLGPSGCGKSTTLNCIGGLTEVTSGRILFGDEDVTAKPPRERNIGMVFQSYALYPHLSILDNIAFPLKQKGIGKKERRSRAREVSRLLQIENLLDRKPSEISGGQQQRVGICRAIIKEPRILLLDEPLSNLDARLKIEIREIIRNIQRSLKITCIMVTHDQEEAMAMADKIAILDKGKIQQYDTPEKLYTSPANLFVANFMGNPPMNFIDAVLEADNGQLSLMVNDHRIACEVPLKTGISSQKVKIGMRSHQICYEPANTPKDGETLPVSIGLVENLGREKMIHGMIGKNKVRITVSSKDESLPDFIQQGREGIWNITLDSNICIFSGNTGENLAESTL